MARIRRRRYDRFYALRLHEIGTIKSSPQKIIADGPDWRFLNELKRLRRRQRRSLPAWFSRWPALSGGGYRIRTLKAIRKMPKRQKGVSGLQ